MKHNQEPLAEIPQATPDTVAGEVDRIWTDLAIQENQTSVTLYPGRDPQETLKISPPYGSAEVSDGLISITHHDPRNTTLNAYYLERLRTQEGTVNWVQTSDHKNMFSSVKTDATPDQLARLEDMLKSGTPEQPKRQPGRVAGALGRIARRGR